MSKEDDQAGDDAPLHRTDSSAGDREAPMGDAGFEAPKRPRTAAQIAAFEKARATRAANLAKKTKKAAPESEPEPEPEPEPAPPPATEPAAKVALAPRRKPRSDAGKRRGRLIRYEEEEEGEPEVSSAPPPPYFVIV